jgi:ATP-dependent Clp protease ATP-binding subunit ClpA
MPTFVDAILFALGFSLRSFTDHSVNALLAARKHAVERCHPDISPEHIIFGVATLRRRCAARAVLENLGLNLAREAMSIATLADSHSPAESNAHPCLGPEAKQLLNRAIEHACGLGVKYVATEHLVLGLLGGTCAAADFLRERGITADRFLAELEKLYAVSHKSGGRRGHR